MGEYRVIVVFYRDGAFVFWLIAAVADKGCFVESFTGFALKVFADLVALVAAAAFPVTDKKLIAYIGLPAVKPLYTEVLRVGRNPCSMCSWNGAALLLLRW